MILISTMTMATAKRIWINPPMVYELTIPRPHIMKRMTATVSSTLLPPVSAIIVLVLLMYNTSSILVKYYKS